MPGGDRTGPAGMGPMTGRGAGFCAGSSRPWYANLFGGRGLNYDRGFGLRGGGRGRRHWFYATGLPGWARTENEPDKLAAKQEKQSLKQQAEYLQGSLNAINELIEELENKKD